MNKLMMLVSVVLLTGCGADRTKNKQATEDYSRLSIEQLTAKAESGDAVAQLNLGFMNCQGASGPQNYAEGVKWYRRAAEQGQANAQFQLGCMYSRGEGVPEDVAKACKWLNLAAAGGIGEAMKLRVNLEKRMTPEQIAEGKKLSREFKPKPEAPIAPANKPQ